jgi:hypothetical protein
MVQKNHAQKNCPTIPPPPKPLEYLMVHPLWIKTFGYLIFYFK